VTADDRRSWRAGLRDGVPVAVAAAVVGVSFGVLAREAGMPALAAIAFSGIVFAGSAQFASLAILGQGGGVAAAVGAAALMNSRFLPMSAALAPSLPGGPWARAAQGQAVVDASWAMAADGKGGFDRFYLFGLSAAQYLAWLGGTLVGALGGTVLGDPEALGLDAVYPAFFLALLFEELRAGRRAQGVALAGALIALVLVPIAPPGIPVLAASCAALAGLWGRS
jgi:predicted branched-subunit amino acid permease